MKEFIQIHSFWINPKWICYQRKKMNSVIQIHLQFESKFIHFQPQEKNPTRYGFTNNICYTCQQYRYLTIAFASEIAVSIQVSIETMVLSHFWSIFRPLLFPSTTSFSSRKNSFTANPEFEFIKLTSDFSCNTTTALLDDLSCLRIEQSCNGLLCCRNYKQMSEYRSYAYYIYNPSIKQLKSSRCRIIFPKTVPFQLKLLVYLSIPSNHLITKSSVFWETLWCGSPLSVWNIQLKNFLLETLRRPFC